MKIYCCSCKSEVDAKLITGVEVYPHRPDLSDIPFWQCSCGNFVGCHHKTKNRTKPLGVIADQEIKNARKHIHSLLDPIWKKGFKSRNEVYSYISDQLGFKYHTAELRDIDTARKVYKILKEWRLELTS